jgi:hypothetical protein
VLDQNAQIAEIHAAILASEPATQPCPICGADGRTQDFGEVGKRTMDCPRCWPLIMFGGETNCEPFRQLIAALNNKCPSRETLLVMSAVLATGIYATMVAAAAACEADDDLRA